ncbi:MAG: 50S ribosomal protein L19 [Deltaproteobacteria bacterium]|nr:50S ribosomal protein L19 [Deltaproteobacteria bacterium]
MGLIEKINQENLRKDLPKGLRPGDSVRVHCRIREGDKDRIQIFEGIVLQIHRGSVGASFTVRKSSYGVGVERVFPLHSPSIDRLEIVSKGRVRRARLTYLRKLSGKAARIESERNITSDVVVEEAAASA